MMTGGDRPWPGRRRRAPRQGGDVEIEAVPVEDPGHEEVAGAEDVPGHPLRGLPMTPVIGTSESTAGIWQDWQLWAPG